MALAFVICGMYIADILVLSLLVVCLAINLVKTEKKQKVVNELDIISGMPPNVLFILEKLVFETDLSVREKANISLVSKEKRSLVVKNMEQKERVKTIYDKYILEKYLNVDDREFICECIEYVVHEGLNICEYMAIRKYHKQLYDLFVENSYEKLFVLFHIIESGIDDGVVTDCNRQLQQPVDHMIYELSIFGHKISKRNIKNIDDFISFLDSLTMVQKMLVEMSIAHW